MFKAYVPNMLWLAHFMWYFLCGFGSERGTTNMQSNLKENKTNKEDYLTI